MTRPNSRFTVHGYFPEKPEDRDKEFIRHEFMNHEFWICNCGNTPIAEGFVPCDIQGNEVDPDPSWDGIHYVCKKCGRIIHQGSFEVVGHRKAAT